jgi:hypothetical protein
VEIGNQSPGSEYEGNITNNRRQTVKKTGQSTKIGDSILTDIVDWLIGCKYGFIPYLQNNWTLHVSTIVTF